MWQTILEPVRNSQLIKDGWLLPCKVLAPSGPNVKGVSVSGGEYNQTALGQRMAECTVFADVFKWWKPYRDIATIVFVPGVKYAWGLHEQFRSAGFPVAAVVEGGTKQKDRDRVFSQFDSGELKVLISVDVLKEGFDAPQAGVMLDLQPNKQFRTWWQKVGRIKRPHPGQEEAIVLDFAGNVWRFLHPNDDPNWDDVTGKLTTQDMVKKKREQKKEQEPWSCPHCAYTLSPWERLTDGKCPSCGREFGRPKKRIRMQDGSLREIAFGDKPRIKKTIHQQTWDKFRYIAHHSGKTLDFARVLYHKQTGEWPDETLKPKPPDPDSGDWKRRPADVYEFMR